MSELNFDLLKKNIKALMDKHDMTQAQFAEIAGMTQPNLSKALSPNESKEFTLEQLFRIAQHFKISIDELTGNRSAADAAISPRAVFKFLVDMLCTGMMRTTKVVEQEEVYDLFVNNHGYPDCKIKKADITYNALYFQDYYGIWDLAFEEHAQDDLHSEFCMGGNESKYKLMNEALNKMLPIIKLYREGDIAEEAFQMIVNGYIEQLSNK